MDSQPYRIENNEESKLYMFVSHDISKALIDYLHLKNCHVKKPRDRETSLIFTQSSEHMTIYLTSQFIDCY